MLAPLSWLRALVPSLTADPDEVAAALIRAGLEVEHVHRHGADLTGVVVGRVLDVEELTGFKKPIRYGHVDIGSRVHEVVCGATNFGPGDRVAFATPGSVLPGPFPIARRQTYGHTSDGMICSARELGLSDDHTGILVLPGEPPLGSDVAELLGLRDEVLDIAVLPDRGYVLSLRGIAREAATAFGLAFTDPALVDVPAAPPGHPVTVDAGCDRYVARTVTGLSAAASPLWLQRRLTLAGMRPISLAVDVTNHVMLELGQPLHAFDLDLLSGPIRVRRAAAGERLVTLDGQDRALDPEDLIIADDSGPVALAGVMGGAATEIGPATSSILLESARFDPVSVARTARRHRLGSEASRRFERGIDASASAAAAEVAVRLLASLGGARADGRTDIDTRVGAVPINLPVSLPGAVAGRSYSPATVAARLADVGCSVSGVDPLEVQPPPWRPDLALPVDLVEEVLRLEGYDTIPVTVPRAPVGRGLSPRQRAVRRVSRGLAAAGLDEVTTSPFTSAAVLGRLGQEGPFARIANPLSAEEDLLRSTLLAGLLPALSRNVARGLHDVALFETGQVVLGPGAGGELPPQPLHAAGALCGQRADRARDWSDAVEAALAVGVAAGVDLVPVQGVAVAWHPGRCASLRLGGVVVGSAGELHPRVVAALGLPLRTCAFELDLEPVLAAAVAAGPRRAPALSAYPPASVDVALVVGAEVPAGEVAALLRSGAGPLLEDLRLFDVYSGPQVGEGRRSLAFSLRFRAPDRTLTDAEVNAARDAAVTAAAAVGAALRS